MIVKSAAFHWRRFDSWYESKGGELTIGMIILSPFVKGGGYLNTIHHTHNATLPNLHSVC
jgi:hypothetical protein